MVDCGNPHCAHERRSFRRDIQVLSKKLPLVLGLERIAADYVDEDTAKLLLNPYPAWEQEHVQDFEPPKRCFHCDKKLPNVYKRIHRIIDEAKKGKDNNGKICLRSLQDLMPFCLDFYTNGFGQELFGDVVKAHFLTSFQQPEIREETQPQVPVPSETITNLIVPHLSMDRLSRKQEAGKQSYTEEDLGCAVSDVRSGKLGTRRAASIYGIPRSTIRNKLIKLEPEVVVLRDQLQRPHVAEAELNQLDHDQNQTNLKMSDLNMFDFSKPKQARVVLSHVPTVPFPVSAKLEPDDHNFLLEQHLNEIRRLHNLNGFSEVRPRLAHSNHLKLPLLVDVVHKLVHQKFMEVKHNFGWKVNALEVKSKHHSEIFNPVGTRLPTFSSYHAACHNNENLSAPVYKHIMKSIYSDMMRKDIPVPKRFGKVNECSRIGDTLKDIIAKSISAKMRFRECSSDEGSLPSVPNIDKVITAMPSDRCVFSFGSDVPQTSKESKNFRDGSSPPKRPKKNGGQPGSHSEASDTYSGFPATKKTRPKRGQYRKYNSQLLMDAVKAVQRGEMSVHRAGSYFGVPHSTLEYKVKERHLLRQRKLRDTQSPSSGSKNTESTAAIETTGTESGIMSEDDELFTSKKRSSSSSARSSISSVSSTSSPPLTTSFNTKTPLTCTSKSFPLSSPCPSPVPSNAMDVPPSKHLHSLDWFQPYLTSTSHNRNSTIGLIPSSLTLKNSASELLIRLQHKVQAKASSFPGSSAFSLPCMKGNVFDLGPTSSSGATMSDQLALYNESV